MKEEKDGKKGRRSKRRSQEGKLGGKRKCRAKLNNGVKINHILHVQWIVFYTTWDPILVYKLWNSSTDEMHACAPVPWLCGLLESNGITSKEVRMLEANAEGLHSACSWMHQHVKSTDFWHFGLEGFIILQSISVFCLWSIGVPSSSTDWTCCAQRYKYKVRESSCSAVHSLHEQDRWRLWEENYVSYLTNEKMRHWEDKSLAQGHQDRMAETRHWSR